MNYWNRNNFTRAFVKGFIYNDGSFEEVQIDPSEKLKGYGVAYSHPRHLNNYYGTGIKSFKDMDKALDELELFRVLDDNDGRRINIGNKITSEQLIVLEDIFKNHNKPVRAGITSISRKYHKTFEDFNKALKNHNGISQEDNNNISFNSHINNLSEN